MNRPEVNSLPSPTLEIIPFKNGLPVAGGRLDLLVKLGVAFPEVDVDRKPLSLALVIDRSGSMNGQPLEAAKRAATEAVTMLLPGDWVSVVAYDDTVEVLQPLIEVGNDRTTIVEAISQLDSRGMTNLFGGWAEGVSQVMACGVKDAVSRVVILSDGLTNRGVTSVAEILPAITEATTHGVTTSALGLGAQYDEALLAGMADAGRGNYVFLANEEMIQAVFEQEVAGLSALRARNVRLSVTPRQHATLAHADASAASSAGLAGQGPGVRLSDIVAGLTGDYLLVLSVNPEPAKVELLLEYDDVILGTQRRLTFPLDVPVLSPEELDAVPVNEEVREAKTLLRLANLKREFSEAMRGGNVARLTELHGLLKREAELLPVGEERDREEQEIARMEGWIRRRDYERASRLSHMAFRSRMQGKSDAKLEAMREQERRWRQAKMAAVADARARRSAQTALAADPRPGMADGELLFEATLPGGRGRVQLVRGDIVKQSADAFVNSTSRAMIGAGGVDGALARAGGKEHVAAMRAIGSIDYGEAVFTPAHGVAARYVIHTASPFFSGDPAGVELLERSHVAAFTLARTIGARSVVIPAMGTGNLGYPPAAAAQVAAHAAESAMTPGAFDLVRFVVVEDDVARAYAEALQARF